jgi:phosphoribosyl-ATP pyrophosphohydrolase
MDDILRNLSDVIEARRKSDPDESYVSGLFASGVDGILKKVGEEATELVLAGKGGDRNEVVYEAADLWFHSVVLLKYFDLEVSDVLDELERRSGMSGIEEKANRQK